MEDSPRFMDQPGPVCVLGSQLAQLTCAWRIFVLNLTMELNGAGWELKVKIFAQLPAATAAEFQVVPAAALAYKETDFASKPMANMR